MTSHHHHHTEATMDLDPITPNDLDPFNDPESFNDLESLNDLEPLDDLEPLHVTLTISTVDSYNATTSPIAATATIEFSTPEWVLPWTARQAPLTDPYNATTSPDAATATIDFSTPEWIRRSTVSQASLTSPYGLTQNLVSQNDDIGYTVQTDYDEESSLSMPLTTAGVSQPMRMRSRTISLAVPNNALSSPWRKAKYPAEADLYYNKAKRWSSRHTRPLWSQRTFEYSFYLILLTGLYFLLIGRPFWVGAVHGFW